MSKRRHEEDTDDLIDDIEENPRKKQPVNLDPGRKHTLDSDEEDSDEEDKKFNVLDENDIEGEEDGEADVVDDVKITPFNMKEELEEGHFDKEGHFHWDKSKQVTDNWLDNIDWIKIKKGTNYKASKDNKGLGDDSDSDDDDDEADQAAKNFDLIGTYEKIIKLMKPMETVKKTLQRLGASTARLSSIERWRRKKAGIVDESSVLVTQLTELCNEILTQTGNMDIYEEKYEEISKKINKSKPTSSSRGGGGAGTSQTIDDDLDMYADDFDTKEKAKFGEDGSELMATDDNDTDKNGEEDKDEEKTSNVLLWEYKWKQTDETIHGQFTTEQMQNWVEEGYFKDGVLVRKVGIEDQKFYTSNRIDFELYL